MKYDGIHIRPICRADDAGEDTGGEGASGGTLLTGGADAGSSEGQQAGSVDGGTGQTQTQTQDSQSGSQAFDFRTLINDEGEFQDGWIDKLPENLKEHSKHFSKYKSPIHALEHTRNLQQLLGQKAEAVVIPKEGASQEEWATFRSKMGIPETPEGYDLKPPEELPEGVTVDENDLKEFAGLAHEIGLTPQQVAKLQEYDLGRFGKLASSSEEQALAIEAKELADNQEILKKEWGSGPEMQEKITLATRAGMTLGFSKEELTTDPIFRNAKVVKMLANVGSQMKEDTLATGSEGSPESLGAKAKDIINNKSNPEYERYWNGDDEVVKKVNMWIRNG